MAKQQVQNQVVKEDRLPLIGAYSNRDGTGSKDQRFINMFPETRKVEQLDNIRLSIHKRAGISQYKDFGTGEGRGLMYFNSKLYVAIGNTVYEDAVSPVSKITMSTSTGHVGMVQGNSTTIGDYLFICDGVDAWFIDTAGTVTAIDDSAIRTIILDSAGAGYGATPTVSITGGGGSGATATATVLGGVVISISLTNPGTGYTSTPTVTIGAPVTTINPATAINYTSEIITVNNNYATGSAVVYSNGGGTSIGGLTNGTTYYVIAVSNTQIKLATSSANATAGTAINLTSGATGTAHTFTGTVTAGASAYLNAFPSPHIPTPVFIDGYILLAQRSDIYNCVLDEPSQWDASNYLTAEMFPDPLVALSRQNNQVVGLGANSIEFFYDAANINGSPLTRNDSTTIQMGCAAPYAVVATEKYFSYISQSESGGRGFWIVEGFQPKKVSDEYIDRILDLEADQTQTRGFAVRSKGHFFYVLNLKSTGRSLVYDPDEKLWHEWSSNNSGSHGIFQYDYVADDYRGIPYILHSSNGIVGKLNPSVYQDISDSILVDITTHKYDFDTYKRKFFHNIKIVGDRYSTATSLNLRWSDDDYQTWSNTKVISLSDDFPAFHRLGSSRRRAFNLTHSLNSPLRLESLEVMYSVGSS